MTTLLSNNTVIVKAIPKMPLKEPLLSGYNETASKNSIRSSIDNSIANKRERSTANPQKLKLSFFVSANELQKFDDFYENKTKAGALKFNFDDPITGVENKFRFINKEPVYNTLSHNHFRIDLEMEKLP